jgi:hypothetical protein
MGWNGGVSLAVWMGDVAVELDDAGARHPAGRATSPSPVRASAGGLSGALLAGAIAHRRP